MAHQDSVASAMRGGGGATGGDATTSRGKQEGGATRGSAKVARGKRTDAKRRRSSAQHNNQPTTERVMAKIARGRLVAEELRGGAAAQDATTNKQQSGE
jgi:hypothetical protein